jgi:transmembrane sensor
MSGTRETSTQQPARETLAEAAAWIAELHDAERSPHVQARVRAWLKDHPSHRVAFERMTRAWESSGALGREVLMAADRRVSRRRAMLRAVALAAVLAGIAIAAAFYLGGDVVATHVGEQQSLLLSDGTRVLLNTDTRLVVRYDSRARRVQLLKGEALFDVSRRATWPFIVSAGGRDISALGTLFIVRCDESRSLAVTLVEGRVRVAPTGPSGSADVRVLTRGQRLTVSPRRAPAIDVPELGRVTAWETGRVEFDATPLSEAAREMNRYSERQISVDPEIAALEITGVFRAADLDEFVKAVATAFSLSATEKWRTVRLSRRPAVSDPE